jgi:hypothetical protein
MTDTLLMVCEGVYYVLLNILLVPVAILGLFFDKLRRCLRKVSDDVALFYTFAVSHQTQLQTTETDRDD